MQQKKASGLPQRSWPYGTAKCIFCKTVMRKGEEDISHVSQAGGGTLHMHRQCLEQWLDDHPPLDGTIPPRKVEQAQELEREFEELRKHLLGSVLPTPAKKAPARKATAKRTTPQPPRKARPKR